MYSTDRLHSRLRAPGPITLREGPNGVAVAEVRNRQARASIALQGAQLLSWTPRRQEHEVIWLSPAARFGEGRPIRGGVPVCWPWFGPHPSEPSFPAHGFVRTAPWEIIEARALGNGASRLGFRLVKTETAEVFWPHSSPVELYIEVGEELEIVLVTRNAGSSPITVEEALHSYFKVSDIRRVRIHGLDGCLYIDKTAHGQRKRQFGPLVFSGETDRIYLDTTTDCVIDDPGLNRRIRIGKQGSRSTVVWNPWIEKSAELDDLEENGYAAMVCVESANTADNRVTVPPGGEHRLSVRYSVEAQ
jgi:glucose-6-phosphate 1-epimerase